MCGGICGPQGSDTEDRYWNVSKPTKQRKVPYKNHSGTVLASYEAARTFVEMYQTKDGGYMVSWRISLSTGAASYRSKREAKNHYNRKVPYGFKID